MGVIVITSTNLLGHITAANSVAGDAQEKSCENQNRNQSFHYRSMVTTVVS